MQLISLGFGGYQALKIQQQSGEIKNLPRLHFNESASVLSAVAALDDTIGQGEVVQAIDRLKLKTQLTNHTLLPWADAVYTLKQCQQYIFPNIQSEKIKVWLTDFIATHDNQLPMLDLALALASKVNGVSRLHSRIALGKFKEKYPQITEMPSVTNGVDLKRWAPTFTKFLQEKGLIDEYELPTVDYKTQVDQLSSQELWTLKQEKKQTMREYLRTRKDQYDQAIALDDNAIVATFAHRFVDYKRPDLLFREIASLRKLLQDNPNLHIMMAGKIHPNNIAGKDKLCALLARIDSEGLGNRIYWVQDYDVQLGQRLVVGSDIWLNTPKRGEEACGTSGMKAQMNGAILVSTADSYTDEMSSIPNQLRFATLSLELVENYRSLKLIVLLCKNQGF